VANEGVSPDSLPVASLPPAKSSGVRTHAQFSFALGLFALGGLLALQVNTQRAIRAGDNPTMGRPDRWYQEQIRMRDQRLATLESRSLELSKRLEQFEQASGKSSQQSKVLQSELNAARMLAGLVAVEGAGVVVTLSDNKKKLADDLDFGLVHDEDLLKLANELFNAGAEAVAVNGIRLLAGWDIRCAGNTIRVSGQRVTSPCKVEAIGDPQLISGALLLPGGIVDSLRGTYGLLVHVRVAPKLTLSAGDAEPLKHARPTKGPTGGGNN